MQNLFVVFEQPYCLYMYHYNHFIVFLWTDIIMYYMDLFYVTELNIIYSILVYSTLPVRYTCIIHVNLVLVI